MPVNVESELMDTLLIAAIGKALVKKGILEKSEIIDQLALFPGSDSDNDASKQLEAILQKLSSAVSRW